MAAKNFRVYIINKENVNLEKLTKKGHSQNFSISGVIEEMFPFVCGFSKTNDANFAVYEVKDHSLRATVYSYPGVDFSSDNKFFKKEKIGINNSNKDYSILIF